MKRRTKIICTVGPSSNNWKTIRAMQLAGMDAVRINMSHATHDDAAETIHWVDKLNQELRHHIPILLDTNGPEIRTGPLAKPLSLQPGESVLVSSDKQKPANSDTPFVYVGYKKFNTTLRTGDRIRLDNGLINLNVVKKTNEGLLCNVEDGGVLGSRKHVNLPGVYVDLPTISARDKEAIEFAKAHNISFIAQSFVRAALDIQVMRDLLGESHHWVKVIAKIENQDGVREAEAIAMAADGIMVARGDLGIETDISALPRLQRNLVRTSLGNGRRCMVATHLLESMIENPIPTRAEAIDVGNAVYEGVDALVLSSETSIGQRPAETVDQLRQIIVESEQTPGLNFAQSLISRSVKQSIARSAVELAERIDAIGVIVITRTGLMADLVTNCAPIHVPIFAFSNLPTTTKRLMVNRGVYARTTLFDTDPEKTIQTALQVLADEENLNRGDKFVIVSDVLTEAAVESIQIREVN